MKLFSRMVSEARGDSSESLLQSDITRYINKVKRTVSVDVQKAIYLTSKYNIMSADELDEIRTVAKSKLQTLSDKFDIPMKDLEDLWSLMKTIKGNYKQMPQYMSAREREMIEAGKLAMNDVTIDLETAAGRNAAAKVYTPLVYKIVQQELPKHPNMDRAEMISSGLLGLSNAMNDWKREPDEKTGKVVPFKTYAGYRILQQIQNDSYSTYQALSGRNSYNVTKDVEAYGSGILSTVSLDGMNQDGDSGDFSQDRFAALGAADKPSSSQEEKKWNQLFKDLDAKFSQRDTDIFYRYFGVNGRKKESGVDIAKSYGMTPANVNNGVLNKIFKYIRNNRHLRDILSDIRDIYTESLMTGMLGMSRSQVLEVFAGDDIYINLIESTRWEDKNVFVGCIKRALSSFRISKESYNILLSVVTGDFKDIDNQVRRNGKLIRQFLSLVYPTVAFKVSTDGDLIEYVTEIQEYCHKYGLDIEYFQK